MKKYKKQKSIAAFIRTSFGTLVFTVLFTVSAAGLFLSLGNNVTNAQMDLYTTTQVAADRVAWAIKSYQNAIEALGTSHLLSNPDAPLEQKIAILDHYSEQFGFTRCQILDRFGYSPIDGIYRGNRSYYTAAMSGRVYISDPLISRTDGATTLVVAAPLWKDGIHGTEPVGVVWGSIHPDTLNTLIKSLDVSKNAYAYILGQTGNHVATSDVTKTTTGRNNILGSLNDPALTKVAAIERSMINGVPGKSLLLQHGIQLYSWYPIDNTPGWSLALQAPLHDYLISFWQFGFIVIVISVLTWFATRIVSAKISEQAGRPIHILADQLNRAALGDLNFDIEEIGNTEDVQLIAEASKNLVLRLNNTLCFVDNYKSNTTLSDFIDDSVIRQFASYYEQDIFRGFHLIIMDNGGNVVAGGPWSQKIHKDLHKPSAKPIMIDGRIFGSVDYYLEHGTSMSEERAESTRDMVAHIMTLVAQSNYNRNVQNITRIRNLEDNIQALVEMDTSTSVSLQQLMLNLRFLRKNKSLLNQGAQLNEIEKLADTSIEYINRAVNYSILNDLNTSMTENLYTPAQLAQRIMNDANESGLAKKASITIITSDNLPETLFGDIINISRVVNRIISNICIENKKNYIQVDISGKTHSYATDLSITISNPKYMLSSSQLSRFNAYLAGDIMALGTQTAMSNTSLKFLSIVRLVRMVNGTLNFKSTIQNGSAYIFTLPQVAQHKDGTK